MQKKLNVLIAMCTYNGSLYLHKQLNSLITQTYPVKELIIFDDASTDNTAETLQSYASKHSFIKLSVNPVNIGFTKNTVPISTIRKNGFAG